MNEEAEEPKEDEYGHHAPDYDPRGPDFDHPHTPEREAHMLLRAEREATQFEPQPCPVCGEIHEKEPHSDE
jgi:hypothetical protein